MFQVSSVIRLLSGRPTFAAMRVQSCVVPSPLSANSGVYTQKAKKLKTFAMFFLGSQTSLCAGNRAWYLRHSQLIREFLLFRPLWGPCGHSWGPRVLPETLLGPALGTFWAVFGHLWASWAVFGTPGRAIGVSGRGFRGSLVGFGGLWAPPGSPLVRSGGLFGVPGCRTGRPRTPRDAPGSRQIAAGSTRERSRAPRDCPRPPETALPQSGFRAVQNAPGRF